MITSYEVKDKIPLVSAWIGANIILYWIMCCMQSPAHQYNFIWDSTLLVLLLGANLFVGGLWHV